MSRGRGGKLDWRRLAGTALLDAEADLRRQLHEQGAIENNRRLQHHVVAITRGVTTTEVRADRLRKVILHHHLEAEFAERFKRVYGEPLITAAMRQAAAELRRRKP